MKNLFPRQPARRSGYSLITTLVLIAAAATVLASTLSRTMTNSRLNDRSNAYLVGQAAAEAATEKVLARVMMDFENGGEGNIISNINTYQALVPTTNENLFWSGFEFSDGLGGTNRTYFQRTSTDPNQSYVTLATQYPGLSAFSSNYRVVSNVRSLGNYNFVNTVCQDLQMAEIPVFQFAIFYNNLLEFSDAVTMTVNGHVHCNTNIYVGSPNDLTFNYFVTASGIITNPSNIGMNQSQWTGAVNYNGSPAPGWGTGEPVLNLPLGGATNSPGQIIQLPPAGESLSAPLSFQRFFNKACLVILVTNTTTTNQAITIWMKANRSDTSPITFSFTNNLPTNTLSWTNMWSNWNRAGFNNWVSTNATFMDDREGRTNHVTQIDIGAFGTWIGTNTNCLPKWNALNPFNGIIYVADSRTTNGQYMNCVRLVNGQTIPSQAAVNQLTPYSIPGLTVATVNPLYIWGFYNCPNAQNLSSTNTIGTRPCSVICDAVTILSPAWTDANSFLAAVPSVNSDDTVNTAIIAGNVPTTANSLTTFSGGVQNLTRMLENWSGRTLWINTSIINLYASAQATKQFKQPSTYYSPPQRKYSFDQNFSAPGGLPPGPPRVNRVIRATWFNPRPGDVTSTPSPALSFVPR